MNVITIGRTSENTVVVSDDLLVSRHHLQMVEDGGRYWVIDMGSTNGTFVNGNRIRGKVEIDGNAVVKIGNTVLPWKQYFYAFNSATSKEDSIDPESGIATSQPIDSACGGSTLPSTKYRTNRSLAKYFFLSLVTLGIYAIVVLSHISEEINYVARKDGRHTMHYCLIFFVFSWITLGIVPLVWYHRLSNRMGNELARRGLGYNFDASDYWLWNILGRFIFVGPFIYIHKMMKAMNLLNNDYNDRG